MGGGDFRMDARSLAEGWRGVSCAWGVWSAQRCERTDRGWPMVSGGLLPGEVSRKIGGNVSAVSRLRRR